MYVIAVFHSTTFVTTLWLRQLDRGLRWAFAYALPVCEQRTFLLIINTFICAVCGWIFTFWSYLVLLRTYRGLTIQCLDCAFKRSSWRWTRSRALRMAHTRPCARWATSARSVNVAHLARVTQIFLVILLRSRKHHRTGLSNFQRDRLLQLADMLGVSGAEGLTSTIRKYLKTDVISKKLTAAKKHMDIMAGSIVQAMGAGAPLQTAGAKGSRKACGIFNGKHDQNMTIFAC
jgi:hypothetical protein